MAALGSHFGGISRALANRDYRVYWSGQVLSVQGVWINRVAGGLLILELTGSYTWLGTIGFLHLIPIFLFGPLGGALADRFGHRRAALTAMSINLVLVCLLTLLTFLGQMTAVSLAVLTGIIGIATAFEFPARQAFIPRLVRREDLSAAVAMNSTTFNIAALIGPAIGSWLFISGGAALAFFVQALTIAWMFVALLKVRVRDIPKEANTETHLWRDIREGAAYTFRDENLRWIFIISITFSMLIRSYTDMIPGFAVDIFAAGDQAKGQALVGILLPASGGGALIMAIALAMRARAENLATLMVVAGIASSISLAAFASTAIFWVGVTTMFLTGAFVVTAAISAQTLVQNVVRNEYRARTISLYLSMAIGSSAIGTQILGIIADITGLPMAVGGAAIIGLVAMSFYAKPIISRKAGMEAEPDYPGR